MAARDGDPALIKSEMHRIFSFIGSSSPRSCYSLLHVYSRSAIQINISRKTGARSSLESRGAATFFLATSSRSIAECRVWLRKASPGIFASPYRRSKYHIFARVSRASRTPVARYASRRIAARVISISSGLASFRGSPAFRSSLPFPPSPLAPLAPLRFARSGIVPVKRSACVKSIRTDRTNVCLRIDRRIGSGRRQGGWGDTKIVRVRVQPAVPERCSDKRDIRTMGQTSPLT